MYTLIDLKPALPGGASQTNAMAAAATALQLAEAPVAN